MQIEIIKAGILTSIQDMGRLGYRDIGVPLSGVMDEHSARLANLVIGNSENAALIECTMGGVIFKTESDVLIAYAGAGASLMINEQAIDTGRPIFIPANQLVNIIPNNAGSRIYVAIAGGWNVPLVMNSRSTYVTANIGGYEGRLLKAGDRLNNNSDQYTKLNIAILRSLASPAVSLASWHAHGNNTSTQHSPVIRVMAGREGSWFSPETQDAFYSSLFSVSLDSNRMGYRIKGPSILANNFSEMLSTAVLPGCIQVTPSGDMIILMADCQTTGGYPRIAQVILVDLPLCAQLRPGQTFNFARVTREEAISLYLAFRKDLDQVSDSIKMKYNIDEKHRS